MSTVRRPGGSTQRGSAYLLALAVILVLTGLGIVISEMALSERRLGTVDHETLQALNAAESGLALAAARLLAGAEPEELDLSFGLTRLEDWTRSSRAQVEAPVEIAREPCSLCEPAGEWTRASYEISTVGLRQLEHPAGVRTLARTAVRAVLTVQPWPAPGTVAALGDASDGAPACPQEVRVQLAEALAAELHPAGCRFGAGAFSIGATDAETGRSCWLWVPVCLLVTDWAEE